MRRSKLRGSFRRRSRCSLSMACWIAWGKRSGLRSRCQVSGIRSQEEQGGSLFGCTASWRTQSGKIQNIRCAAYARLRFCRVAAEVRCEPSCARLGRASAPVPTRTGARPSSKYRGSLWTDGDQVGEAERWVCASLVVAHVGVVVVVDVGIRNPLEIASTDRVDDVHGAGGAGLRRIVIRILIAGGDIDLAAVGGGGGGERVGVSETRSSEVDGTGESAAYVEQKHSRQVTGDDDHLSAVGNKLRVDRRETARAEIEELCFLGEIHRRSVTGELTIRQSMLRVGRGENVNSPVRRIKCEHVLSVRRRDDLQRDARGGRHKIKVRRTRSIGVSGLCVAGGDTGN